MSKILILAKSGFGKTTSIGNIPELNIKGLNSKETFLISCVNKRLPFKNTESSNYNSVTIDKFKEGNRVYTKNFKTISDLLDILANSPFKNIVIDDFNYPSQDYYMANAMKGGWDTPKQIGYGMGLVFESIDKIPEDKNIFVLAHYEEYKDKNGDSLSYKYKSTGNMVDSYITPEGKFEIVLYGKLEFNSKEKISERFLVTNYDGEFPSKSPYGIFKDIYIPNDLGYVADKIEEFYH